MSKYWEKIIFLITLKKEVEEMNRRYATPNSKNPNKGHTHKQVRPYASAV